VNAATRYHLFLTKTLLWIFIGAGLAVAVLDVPEPLRPVPSGPIWVGLIGMLVYLGLVAIELFGNQSLRAVRWLVALLTIGGFVALADPFVPALALLARSLAVFSLVAIVCFYVLERVAGRDEEESLPYRTPGGGGFIGGFHFSELRQAALALVIGLVLGVGVHELAEARGPFPLQPVKQAWTLQAVKTTHPYGKGTMLTHQDLTWHRWEPVTAATKQRNPDAKTSGVLLLDGGRAAAALIAAHPELEDRFGAMVDPAAELLPGNRADTYVLFDHAGHQERLGDDGSCVKCHHRNAVLDRGTSCRTCHQYKYRATELFDHDVHVARYGGNASCAKCHEPGKPKTVEASKDCADCHPEPSPDVTEVKARLDLPEGLAVGYVDAMHGLCVGCHMEEEAKQKAAQPYLSRCINCHRERPEGESGQGMPGKTTIAEARGYASRPARR
jgi:hypothetical protein